ncbi:Lrp/AsnC family transcriptional regulator [Microbacterium lacus]|uniref:Lrp/AsnC family transcriptional regulator n=1 Tax=Microbacterium lacus TaxID=415217 RepID=UPI00384F1956
MSSAKIAERVGLSDRTVRRRIRDLEKYRGLKVVPVIDPDSIGLSTCIYVGLSVDRAQLEAVALAVRSMPEVRYLAHTTGPWDLLAEAFVGSREHMADFILSSLGKLPGVRKSETFNVLRIAKFGYEWDIPQVVAAPASEVSIAHPTDRSPSS